MGRQIGFYMTEKDEESFLHFLRAECKVGIIPDWNLSQDFRLLDKLPSREEPGWFSVWLWCNGCSLPPIMQYVPKQNHYVIDSLRSEVIEFTKSIFNGERLTNGRLWMEMKYYNEESITVTKSISFEKLYNRLVRWIKKNSKKDDFGYYVMSGAQQFTDSGGILGYYSNE